MYKSSTNGDKKQGHLYRVEEGVTGACVQLENHKEVSVEETCKQVEQRRMDEKIYGTKVEQDNKYKINEETSTADTTRIMKQIGMTATLKMKDKFRFTLAGNKNDNQIEFEFIINFERKELLIIIAQGGQYANKKETLQHFRRHNTYNTGYKMLFNTLRL